VTALEGYILVEGANDAFVAVVHEHKNKSLRRAKEVYDGISGPLNGAVVAYACKDLGLEMIGAGLEVHLVHLGRRTQILACAVRYGEPNSRHGSVSG